MRCISILRDGNWLTTMRNGPTHDNQHGKKSPLRNRFPGQTHFPVISPPLRLPAIVVLIVLTIILSIVVAHLKSSAGSTQKHLGVKKIAKESNSK